MTFKISLRLSKTYANYSKLSVQLWQYLGYNCEYPQTILKLSFCITKMVANAKTIVCLFVTKHIDLFTDLILYIWSLIKLINIDIIYLI